MFFSVLLPFLIQLNIFSYGSINCDINNDMYGRNYDLNQVIEKGLKFYIKKKRENSKLMDINGLINNNEYNSQNNSFINLNHTNNVNKISDKYLELALFIDYYAYNNMIKSKLVANHNEFTELLLAFVNQLQAIYYKTSFGAKIHITLVKIEILDKSRFTYFNGNRDKLLQSFCEFQEKLNPKSDSDPLHWDMAVLLTGLDLYIINETGFADYHPLGLGSIAGICTNDRNCVIAEFGTNHTLGTYWPSSGLMSSWITAHEMAHNFGILHDGLPFNSDCASNDFLMSSHRSYSSQTSWSMCSANSFQLISNNLKCLNDMPLYSNERYNHMKYSLMPGLVFSAHKQCKLFLNDRNAFQFANNDWNICNQTMLCAKPSLNVLIKSGPALDGTVCAPNSVCVDSKCISNK